MAPGYLVYRDPDPPTPLFSENDVQEQQVVSNKENVGHEQTDNSKIQLVGTTTVTLPIPPKICLSAMTRI